MAWRLVGSSVDGELIVDLVPPQTVTIGRTPECTVHLVQRQVSRLHAELHWAPGTGRDPGHWRLRDCGATFGTLLNGIKLDPQSEVRLDHGDLLMINPWQFRVEGPATAATVAEGAQTVVAGAELDGEFEPLARVQTPGELAQGLLVQLLVASEEVAQAADESQVGQRAVESLAAATGFRNVAFLKPGNDPSSFELVAHTGAITDATGAASVSKSLLKRARNGIYVHRGGHTGGGTLDASLAQLSIRQAICVPVETGGTFHGWLYLDNRTASGGSSHELEAAGFASAIARLAGLSLANIARGKMQQRFDLEQQELFGGTMRALISAIDAKDPYTRGHSDRVSEFAVLLAEQAKLPAQVTERVRVCGLVHDIGKIGVPEEILRKPSRLDPEEFARIREHPEVGMNILRDIPQMRDILPGVLEHHERWDGGGYPHGRKGEQISLLGRILCLADCFDAMTSARFYRPARPIEEVREEIRKCLGTHFDPELGQTFLGIRESELTSRISTAPPLQR
jgi:hypothetical protein